MLRKKQQMSDKALWFWTAVLITLIAGWVMNILDIINHTGDVTGLLFLRVIGVFMAPLGAVLGWFA